METARLWLLCPLYEDVDSFLVVKARLLKVLAGLSWDISRIRFVVVDDSAGFDPEVERLRHEPNTEVLCPPFNLGHQRAIVFGLRSVREQIADPDIIVTLDSDGEDQPEDVPRLLAPIQASPSDLKLVVLARRTRRHESLQFKVLYGLFKLMFIALTGTVVRTGNFAAYRGWTARRALFHPHFDLCYSSSLLGLNRPLLFVPCERGSRIAGQSHMNFLKLLMHGFRMLMPFIDRVAIRAMIVFSAVLAAGLAFAVAVIGLRLFTKIPIPGWTTYGLLMVLLLSFVAIGNFIILFALFSQSQGVGLAFLDRGGPVRD
jgi:glycosyltransferase involved in cell wall biosynthesis